MSHTYNSFSGTDEIEPYVLDLYKERDVAWEKIDQYEEIMKRLFILLGENNIPYPEDMTPVYNNLFIWGCWKNTVKDIYKNIILPSLNHVLKPTEDSK